MTETETLPPAVVILAAGKGTRMKSDLPKVLHPLAGRPLVAHVLATARQLSPAQIVLIVGHGAAEVQAAVGDGVIFALQSPQLGTGHAVAQAAPHLQEHAGPVLILYGDMPLLTAGTLRQMLALQAANPGPLTMLTTIAEDPRGFGRIVRDDAGQVVAIVEEALCTPAQWAIKELNVGVYCGRGDWLWPALAGIPLSPTGEYYLTDLVALAVQQGQPIVALTITDAIEIMGINTPAHLAEAEAALPARK